MPIGIAGYVNGQATGNASITALIPAFFGAALAMLGLIGKQSERLRKHAMHAAAAIALLGFVLTAGRLISKFNELSMSPAVIAQLAMSLVSLTFVILAIKSFKDARRSR